MRAPYVIFFRVRLISLSNFVKCIKSVIKILCLTCFASIFIDSTLVALFSVFFRRLKCNDGSEIFFDRGREESYCPSPFDLNSHLIFIQ